MTPYQKSGNCGRFFVNVKSPHASDYLKFMRGLLVYACSTMPEGHTLHRQARDQTRSISGQVLRVCSPQGRFQTGAAELDGKRLLRVEAAGKHLLYRFDDAPTLHVHLGLFGKFRQHLNPAPEPRGAVRVRFTGTHHTIDLAGPNQCELLNDDDVGALLARLGPDPLRDDADPRAAWQRIRRSRSPIGLLLMDQSVVSGIGNIYRTELLWRLRVHPKMPGNTLTRPKFNRLWKDAVALLNVGVKYNRIITVDLKRSRAAASKLRQHERVNIFNRSTCPRCQGPVTRFELATRRVFACERCQPLPVCANDPKSAPADASGLPHFLAGL